MIIYEIKNKINGKSYIGQHFKNEMGSYWGSDKLIKMAIEKYGIENFERTILEKCSDKNELNERANKRLNGDIKFENVWMSYQGEDWVLRDLSFHIKSGEKIGLVGKTGCGKSSTVSLMTRLYEFQQGQILIDDVPLRLYERNSLRDQIGFVAQDAVIFKGSLRENLSAGAEIS